MEHDPQDKTKFAQGYVTDEGEEIPSHNLHAVDCSCGYQAAVWMSNKDRARAIYERSHLRALSKTR